MLITSTTLINIISIHYIYIYWYIIRVDIFINKTIIRVNAMKSDVFKMDTKNY